MGKKLRVTDILATSVGHAHMVQGSQQTLGQITQMPLSSMGTSSTGKLVPQFQACRQPLLVHCPQVSCGYMINLLGLRWRTLDMRTLDMITCRLWPELLSQVLASSRSLRLASLHCGGGKPSGHHYPPMNS